MIQYLAIRGLLVVSVVHPIICVLLAGPLVILARGSFFKRSSRLRSPIPPSITITKTANPTSVPETGGNVTYTVVINNTSEPGDPVTITSLNDNVFGNISGQGTCSVPQTIAVAGSYTCTFTKNISGNAGGSHVNTVTATGADDEEAQFQHPMMPL